MKRIEVRIAVLAASLTMLGFGCDEDAAGRGGTPSATGASECVGNKCDNAPQSNEGEIPQGLASAAETIKRCLEPVEARVTGNPDRFRYGPNDAEDYENDIETAESVIQAQRDCMADELEDALFDLEDYYPKAVSAVFDESAFARRICSLVASVHSFSVDDAVRGECDLRMHAAMFASAAAAISGGIDPDDLSASDHNRKCYSGFDRDDGKDGADKVLACLRDESKDTLERILAIFELEESDKGPECVDLDRVRDDLEHVCKTATAESPTPEIDAVLCQAELEGVLAPMTTSMVDWEGPSGYPISCSQ